MTNTIYNNHGGKNSITGNKPRVETHLRRKPASLSVRIDQAVKDELYKTVASQNRGYYHNKISAFVQKAISEYIKKVKKLENPAK